MSDSNDNANKIELNWDDDPMFGTGKMMGIYAQAESHVGSYQIMRWHGERMVPEWTHSDGSVEGPGVKYGSGHVTLIIDGKEEQLAKTRTIDEAVAEAKKWCEHHAASLLSNH